MTHRHFTPSTPPFAFPAILSDLALGRAHHGRPTRRLLAPALPEPAAIVVTGLFMDAIDRAPSSLTVLELGAGAGRCGRLLARQGVATIVAVDPEPVTGRHGVYADHVVGELTALDPVQRARLERHRFDGLVAACGLGPRGTTPSDFVEAIDHVARGGWICVALDVSVLGPDDASGFGALVRALSVRGVIEIEATSRFEQRAGGRLREQVAVLARKGRAIYDA